jgi:hypothetical protein
MLMWLDNEENLRKHAARGAQAAVQAAKDKAKAFDASRVAASTAKAAQLIDRELAVFRGNLSG